MKSQIIYRGLMLLMAVFVSSSSLKVKADDGAALNKQVDFQREIQPILLRCVACHGQDEESREGDLRLDDRQAALDSGAIVPGQPEESSLIDRVMSDDEDLRMPPVSFGEHLKVEEIAVLRRWINNGANYEKHWSLIPPRRPELPLVGHLPPGFEQDQPLDRFILTKLAASKLTPSVSAPRHKLIRRLSLDLTGLPPSGEDYLRFEKDTDPQAYEHLVDRLLASPSFGEHWARHWLDRARYADSLGYAQDELRVIWRYRDWVIDAFNRDLPFDQFTIEQLAGDMLSAPTMDQNLATAFHRNTMTNNEGGTDDEEFRHAAIVDRVNTTMQVWMGLTAGCAQCHTHKYDPITFHDYYSLFAIFNQTKDNDQRDDSPRLTTPTESQRQAKAELSASIANLSKEEGTGAKKLAKLTARLKKLEEEIVSTPVMQELEGDKRRKSYLCIRGAFNNHGEEVMPAIPVAFGQLASDKPADRLALARWLVSNENPLTARVAANRVWENIFGTGLVETSEDFGTQGMLPSHSDLLDWLAVEYIENGWSTKQLIKTIVLSATYRQETVTTPEKMSVDPRNRLYSRGVYYRLSAEQIRDQALAVSGLLSPKIHGPSVRPPQPKTGLGAAFGGSLDWTESVGEDRYRRGIYTLIRRTSTYPSLIAFDATNRSICNIRRIRTNSPVAAFVTLNDPVFVEAAQAFARRMLGDGSKTPEQIIEFAFLQAIGRSPNNEELNSLMTLYSSEKKHYDENLIEAYKMATQPLGELEPNQELAATAAWTVVANVILNLDELLTRN